MGDDSGRPPLERRAPKASLASPVSMSRPELPEALLQRMQAVVNAAHAQAVKEDEAQREHAESDTDPFLPRLTHSGSIEERAARAERERAAEAAWAERELAAQAEQELAAQAEQAPPHQSWRPLSLRPAPVRRRSRTIVLAVGAAVLLAAGPLTLALTRPHATPKLGAAERTSNEAAAWVAQQVSPDDVVSCDLAMCLALEAHGVSVSDLLRMDPSARDLLSSQVVVSTAAIRNLFGSRLSSVYAPAVLASFGSGTARIDIRQIAPDGAAAYQSALRVDEQERKTFETTLAGSLQIVASSQAHSQLVGGQVDARLGTLIEGMASELPQPVRIMEFGNLGPGASVGVPLRSATLVGSVATLRSTLAFALAQNDPHHPARAEITRLDGRQVLFVEFTAPSPLGLFNPTGS